MICSVNEITQIQSRPTEGQKKNADMLFDYASTYPNEVIHGSPDTILWPIFIIMCYGALMDVVPPLSPPRDSPVRAPCLQPLFPRMHLSLLLLPPLRPFVVYFRPPSSAGCHPPSARTTDWRPVPCCPRCPVQRPNVEGLPPRPVWLVVLGSGVGGGA